MYKCINIHIIYGHVYTVCIYIHACIYVFVDTFYLSIKKQSQNGQQTSKMAVLQLKGC